MHGAGWFNVQTGMSQVIVEPCGNCFCGVKEATTSACSEGMKINQKVSTILGTVFVFCIEAGNQCLSKCSDVLYVYVCACMYKIVVCGCNCISIPFILFIH
jgi:hypothetical protein